MHYSNSSELKNDTVWMIELAAAYTVVNIAMTAAGEIRLK